MIYRNKKILAPKIKLLHSSTSGVYILQIMLKEPSSDYILEIMLKNPSFHLKIKWQWM